MLQKAYTPFRIRELQLKNRFIKTATYEGMCDNGRPTQQPETWVIVMKNKTYEKFKKFI